MAEYYKVFGQASTLSFLMIVLLGIVWQTLYISQISGRTQRMIWEALVLGYLCFIAIMLRKINEELSYSFLMRGYHDWFQYGYTVILIILGLRFNFVSGGKRLWIGVLLVSIGLPCWDFVYPGLYVKGFVLSVIGLTVRAAICYVFEWKRQNTEITEHSIREALDVQHSGLLFSEKDGYILLINRQMLTLMNEILGTYTRNANHFWEVIQKKAVPRYDLSSVEENGFLFASKTDIVWQFIQKQSSFYGRPVNQVIATDVTQAENVTRELKKKQDSLEQTREQLKTASENLEELRKEEANSLLWNHVHDVLGQRISMLQREFQKEDWDYEWVKTGIENLLLNLSVLESVHPKERYDEMVHAFAPLGVQFQMAGEFPNDAELSGFLVDVIREAASNAVRHGGAELLEIRIESDNNILLCIQNDGSVPEQEIRRGGGLQSISAKVKSYGGTMKIEREPKFSILIQIPWTEKEG